MGYLFDSLVPKDYGKALRAAQNSSQAGNYEYLEGECVNTTTMLLQHHGRVWNRPNDYEAAKNLVRQMGGKFRHANGIHAMDFVDEWRMVSNNYQIISDMVFKEIYHAYQLGLDTSDSQVIGKMFYLATQIWSLVGEYTSFSQKDEKR